MSDELTELARELLKTAGGDHPLLPLPSEAEVVDALKKPGGLEDVRFFFRDRLQKIRAEKENPLEHGYRPPIWDLCDDLLCAGKEVWIDLTGLYLNHPWADKRLIGSEFEREFKRRVPKPIRTTGARELNLTGGNRGSKSWFCAWYSTRDLVKNAGRIWWYGALTNETSIDTEQWLVNYFLPAQWRNMKQKNGPGNTRYSEKNGFTDKRFVLPNRSKGLFKNYAQDDDTLEGPAIDGAWLDEHVPKYWVETIRMRLVDKGGKLLVSFTPTKGYTPAVGEFRDGAKTLVSMPAVLLPEETANKVQRCKHDAHVVYINPLLDNAFANHEEIRAKMQGRSKRWIMQRVEGEAHKKFGALVTTFRRDVHVVRPAQIPEEGTRFFVMDPGGKKPWVLGWYLVTPGDHRTRRIYKYREWPCQALFVPALGYVEEWAVAGSKADGDPGPGQDPIGWGVDRYVEEVKRCESGQPLAGLSPLPGVSAEKPEEIFARYGDARALGSPQAARGEVDVSLEEMLCDAGLDVEPITGRGPGEFAGLNLLLEWFDWDVSRPPGADNEPKFFINEECENSIAAYEMWTGADVQRGACKDFIDTDRYFVQTDPWHVASGMLGSRGGGYW